MLKISFGESPTPQTFCVGGDGGDDDVDIEDEDEDLSKANMLRAKRARSLQELEF